MDVNRVHDRIRILLWGGALGLILWGSSGCQTPGYRPTVSRESYEPAARDISIHELARELGMQVEMTCDAYVKLEGGHNTVLIFAYSNAQYYVNGQATGRVGKTKKRDGVLYVSSNLSREIKSVIGGGGVPQPVEPTQPTRPKYRAHRGLVVVDPGHGGKDPGTTSVLGFPEKDINLAVSLHLAKYLEAAGFQVLMTRDTDWYPTLEERADLANLNRADLFISVHADHCATPSVTGFTLYIARNASQRSREVAESVQHAILQVSPQTRGIREQDFRVLVNTRCPAILIELGYLSNYWESRRLKDAGMQKRLAQAIAEGTALTGK